MTRLPLLTTTLLAAGALSGCAIFDKGEVATAAEAHAAVPGVDTGLVPVPAAAAPEPPQPIIVAVPEPLPLPGQLMPVERSARPEPRDPTSRVSAANAAARVEPARDGFINAVQSYPYTAGALYQVYTAPGHVTDIVLQEGERLVGAGPVAAGDTARWIIGDTTSGAGPAARVHILVKPTRPDLSTNLVINTDRRTYHLELRATRATWMASVSWSYPADALIALRQGQAAAAEVAPVANGIALDRLRFDYRITGDRPPWRPVRAYDDGRQVYLEFPAGIARAEMPPLFVVGSGGAAELVNYRVRGHHMVVDRLFGAAELRLGPGRRQQRVRIERGGSGSRD
ncbi:MAG TPA: P-type conjugative transfer protein TrbG [Sphingomonadaceae bacterium]|nr:P-type conjugative transfer protein TrbG [Sphingomonadaceae bacterium]